jgi:hypothetical protein
LFDHAVVDTDGLHTWQLFVALCVPLVTNCPEIQHPAWQLPPLQTFPLPQLAPLVGEHVPVPHELHSPQVVWQHVPLTQWPLVHWLSPVQDKPSDFLVVQVPPLQ